MIRFTPLRWFLAIGLLATSITALAEETRVKRCYLIGNSLTWDTMPNRLDGDVQWHVDCGVNLPFIYNHPKKPCVETSTIWTTALQEKQYDLVSVQPHYGTTLAEDVETISAWLKLQPKAVFVIHSGWAFQAQRASEYDSYVLPTQMTHSPGYLKALIGELQRLHPGREFRQTFAQNLLAFIAEDLAANQRPWNDVAELYRDSIHMTHDHGKYLMHNAMRRALGQPRSDAGLTEKLKPEVKSYLDSVLSWLEINDADRDRLQRILAVTPTVDRSALIAEVTHDDLRTKLSALLPTIERAVKVRQATIALEAEITKRGGRLFCTPTGPQWLYLAAGDRELTLFDLPATIDLYNGNNPLKGQGGRNDQVTDAWLQTLAGCTTLRKLDLANCAIQGEGLRHLADLVNLRELNLTLTPVKDEALRHLSGLTELRSLGLASTSCTGTGFQYLTALRKLENVNFHFTPLNDAGLQAISQVPNSGRFWFAHTKFTDAGAAALSNLTQLKRCGIGSTDPASSGAAVAALTKLPLEDLALLDNQATPEGLAHVVQITTLRRLDVSHAPTVTDETLAQIAQLPKLEEFRLGAAQVTDAGLLQLAASKSLKKLTLSQLKQVTPGGVAALRQAKPTLVVEGP